MLETAPVFLPIVLMLASFAGWRVQRALSDRHRSRETVEAIRLVVGMLVTFSALVLGLLTSSAKTHFDAHGSNLRAYGIDLITMDQQLNQYGGAADPIRAVLRAYTAAAIADTWPDEPAPSGAYPRHPGRISPGSEESVALGAMLLQVNGMVAELDPATPLQRALAPIMVARMQQLLQDRWALVGSAKPTLSWWFLVVMAGWLVPVFAAFGLSAPGNTVIYTVIGMVALSLSVALWLIVELDSPVSGIIHVPSNALRDALLHMDGRPGS